jgi:hypothetical protein
MAGDVSHPSRFAFLEFATIEAARNAMNMSGTFFRDKIIKVNHSNNVINKGIKKESQEMAEALKGLKEAEMLINRKYSEVPVSTTNDQLKIVGSSTNPEVKDESKLIPDMAKELDKPRRSRSRSRSRSRERSRRMRSRSRSRSRSDYYRYAHRRDRDRDRDRDRERERERDRERERRHKERYERELEREHEMMRERERERERRRRESRSRSSSRRKRYSDRERDHYRR